MLCQLLIGVNDGYIPLYLGGKIFFGSSWKLVKKVQASVSFLHSFFALDSTG